MPNLSQVVILPKVIFFDQEITKKFQSTNQCKRCGGKLNCDNYPRKPRGLPPEAEKYYQFRFSFTCGSCRKRATPPSVRFLGRKVYISIVVILISSTAKEIQQAIFKTNPFFSLTTIKRWRNWWMRLPDSSAWRAIQGVISPNTQRQFLPDYLINIFSKVQPSLTEAYYSLLKFISPITTPLDYLTTVQII